MVITEKNMAILKGIFITFFIGIAFYSLFPDLSFINISENIQYTFFWFLICGFTSSFLHIIKRSIRDKQLRILMSGGTIFFIVLFIFQILFTFGITVNDYLWSAISTIFIIFILILAKYGDK